VSSAFGLYDNPPLAEQAVDHLIAAQFSSGDVSVLMRTGADGKTFGGTLGLLTGFGPFTALGADRLIAAGPMRRALEDLRMASPADARITLEDSFKRLGLSEHEARSYTSKINQGYVLLSVQCAVADDVDRALSVLTKTGAQAIAPVPEKNGSLETIAGQGR